MSDLDVPVDEKTNPRGAAGIDQARAATRTAGSDADTERRRSPSGLKAAVYARVSTLDQEPENQLAELRRYVEARGWSAVEHVDRGVSGAKDRRPALDQLLT